MKITFYGTRGSIPVCDPSFVHFGGNTSSTLFEFDDGNMLICDAGTGIREIGKELLSRKSDLPKLEIIIAFTHFHWDHIQGFPFFRPAYDPDFHIIIYAMGKERMSQDVPSLFRTQMQSSYFPVPLEKMGARFSFEYMKEEEMNWRGKQVRVLKHQHPGDAYSFRFDLENGKSFAFCTDIEHGENINPQIIEFAKGADILIHDAQYTEEELIQRRGWGHSSWEQAVEVAQRAGNKHLYLTHHDPDHNDDFLHRMEAQCQQRFPSSQITRDGMEILL